MTKLRARHFLLAIIFLALLLRLPFFTVPALNGNEGDNLDISKKLFEGTSTWERHPQSPPIYPWLWSLSVYFFGMNEFGMRFISIVFGTLTVFLLYSFVRLSHKTPTALLTALFAAIIPYFVLYSRDGHFESTQLFFTILAVFLLEKYKNKQRWKYWLFGGITSGIVLSIKHNGAVILALYWLFILYEQRKQMLSALGNLFAITGIGGGILLLTTGLKIQNIFFLAYGMIFWLINQSTQANVPWHYGIIVLLEGFSPLLFLIIIAATTRAFLHHTKTNREILLCAWIFTCYTLVALLQARKYPRHFILGIPYATILGAHLITSLKKKYKTLLLILVLFSALSWTTYHILVSINTTAVRDMAMVVHDLIPPGSTLYIDGGDYWSFAVYTNYTYNLTSLPARLKPGDYAIVHSINGNYYAGSPLQNDLIFWTPAYAAQYDYKTFNDSTLLHQIPYSTYGFLKLVRIHANEWKPMPKVNTGATALLCSIWQQPSILSTLAHHLLPQPLAHIFTKKCTLGCVHTCDLF